MLTLKSCGILLLAALCPGAQQSEPVYKFSTTVYTFGTTTVSNSDFRGTVYHISPNSTKLPDFSKLKPEGVIYTPALNIPFRSFDEGFPGVTERFEWFAIDYTARFWISRPGTYQFSLASDDGSALYIDGRRLIENDKVHAIVEKAGQVNLKTGAHAIRVSYFQGPRFHVALVLRVAGPGDDDLRIFHTADFKPPAGAEW